MKSRMPYDFNAKERKAMETEIKKQLREFDKKHTLELDALILWQLHEQLGFGPKRLKRFYNRFNELLDEMGERYDFDDSDKIWLCTFKLKEIGIDIEKWDQERQSNTR